MGVVWPGICRPANECVTDMMPSAIGTNPSSSPGTGIVPQLRSELINAMLDQNATADLKWPPE